MPIAVLIPLIVQVGLPLALKLVELFNQNPNATITPEMWEALKKHVAFSDLAGPK